ncbi:hypothetical protein PCANB_001228 [Pneumocystis canis]|nr:hypothetical protein PCK1_001196 [Pneumocystis canis]KAG5437107.1 hypothetical protein PCANB_001228 [Pneumocystis canis]
MVLLVQTERIKNALEKYSSLNNNDKKKDISEYLKSNFIPHIIIADVSTTLKSISRNIEEERKNSLDYILKGTYVYNEKKKNQEKKSSKEHILKLRSIAKEMEYQRLIGGKTDNYENKKFNKYESQLIKTQILTIINILISIFSVITAVWLWCKNWIISTRIITALSSGILIAIAEIIIYNQYLSKIKKRREFEKKRHEKKEIINTTKFKAM